MIWIAMIVADRRLRVPGVATVFQPAAMTRARRHLPEMEISPKANETVRLDDVVISLWFGAAEAQ